MGFFNFHVLLFLDHYSATSSIDVIILDRMLLNNLVKFKDLFCSNSQNKALNWNKNFISRTVLKLFLEKFKKLTVVGKLNRKNSKILPKSEWFHFIIDHYLIHSQNNLNVSTKHFHLIIFNISPDLFTTNCSKTF